MPKLDLPKGSILVMDRAYVNYKLMLNWTNNNITWVTRLNPSLRYEITHQNKISKHHKQYGIESDSIILLGNPDVPKRNPTQTARLITFYDPDKKKELLFLSNNLEYSPVTIAQIYKRRWDIELLFKRIKQTFQFHNFLGDSENAIKVQMWCTLIADLLMNVIKTRVDRLKKQKWSFANLAGLIRQHLTTYIDLFKFLLDPDKALLGYEDPMPPNQLSIFKT